MGEWVRVSARPLAATPDGRRRPGQRAAGPGNGAPPVGQRPRGTPRYPTTPRRARAVGWRRLPAHSPAAAADPPAPPLAAPLAAAPARRPTGTYALQCRRLLPPLTLVPPPPERAPSSSRGKPRWGLAATAGGTGGGGLRGVGVAGLPARPCPPLRPTCATSNGSGGGGDGRRRRRRGEVRTEELAAPREHWPRRPDETGRRDWRKVAGTRAEGGRRSKRLARRPADPTLPCRARRQPPTAVAVGDCHQGQGRGNSEAAVGDPGPLLSWRRSPSVAGPPSYSVSLPSPPPPASSAKVPRRSAVAG